MSYLADRTRHDDARLSGSVPARLLRTALAVADGPSCLVTGGPGTGKTTVGLEVALAAAAAGRRVLLTTGRRTLGTWLRQRLADLLVADGLLQQAVRVGLDPRGRIVAGDVASLTGALPGDGEDAAGFYADRAADWVAAPRFGGRFDVVVVDEWHGLAAAYRAGLGGLLERGGRLVALADPSQATAVDDLSTDAFHRRVDLATDERTVAGLASVRAALFDGAGPEDDGPATEGTDAAVTWVPASGGLHGVARAVVEDLVAAEGVASGDVAVLRLSPGADVVDHAGQDHLAATLRGGGLVEAPAAWFAGLHRRVVVLVLDVEQVPSATSGDTLRRLAALGAARATERLVVVGDPNAVRLRGLGHLADRLATPALEPLAPA